MRTSNIRVCFMFARAMTCITMRSGGMCFTNEKSDKKTHWLMNKVCWIYSHNIASTFMLCDIDTPVFAGWLKVGPKLALIHQSSLIEAVIFETECGKREICDIFLCVENQQIFFAFAIRFDGIIIDVVSKQIDDVIIFIRCKPTADHWSEKTRLLPRNCISVECANITIIFLPTNFSDDSFLALAWMEHPLWTTRFISPTFQYFSILAF